MSRQPKKRTREEVGFDGNDPDIIRGAKNNDFTEVEEALVHDANNIRKVDLVTGMTALHYAAALGNFGMVQFLVTQEDIDIHTKDKFGRDVLDTAIECGHTESIDLLFKTMFPQ